MMDEKGSALADLYNPFPPEKLVEQFKDLFNTVWKESFEFYKTKLKKNEKDAAGRLLQILYVRILKQILVYFTCLKENKCIYLPLC